MARTAIPVDILCLQNSINSVKEGQFDNAFAFYNHIAEVYNTNFSPRDHISHSIVMLRIKAGAVNVPFAIPAGKRGGQPGTKLTIEHKEKMQAGRINKKTATTVGDGVQTWQDNMKDYFGSKKILCNGILAGKKNAAIKAMCINCVGGYQNRAPEDPPISSAIRDCRGYSCPLYMIRPFQKNQAEKHHD